MVNQNFGFGNMDFAKMMQEFKIPGMQEGMSKMMGDMNFPTMPMDGFMETQKKNFEALNDVNKTCFQGIKTVAERQQAFLREAMEEMGKVSRDLMVQGNPEDKMTQQADLLKEGMEKALVNAREMAEIMIKANQEATELINMRFNASMEEFKSHLQKRSTG